MKYCKDNIKHYHYQVNFLKGSVFCPILRVWGGTMFDQPMAERRVLENQVSILNFPVRTILPFKKMLSSTTESTTPLRSQTKNESTNILSVKSQQEDQLSINIGKPKRRISCNFTNKSPGKADGQSRVA